MYKRLIGLTIVLTAMLGFSLFWITLNRVEILRPPTPSHQTLFGLYSLLYSWQSPPRLILFFAIILGYMVAGVFSALELRDLNQSRRSLNSSRKPLSPGILMAQTQGVFYGEVTITVLIPAHNEEVHLGETIKALLEQSRRPDRIIVVADNCTDDTIKIACSFDVEVEETIGNIHKKGGALNQVIAKILPQLGPNDTVMILDADSKLRQGFLAKAAQCFTDDRGLSAVGGQFFGEHGFGFVGQLQRNEYLRYQREIARRRGRVFVLTGTASIFRASALRSVANARGNLIPGSNGNVYDTVALTEDNELTIALKSLGALMTSPSECALETELMPTWRMLWRQRLRWQRGAVENISHYGVTPTTIRYWSQQLGIAYSGFALWAFFLLIFIQVIAMTQWIWYPYWLIILVLFMIERVLTVWKGGWRARLVASLLLPELLYDSFQDIVFLKGVLDIALGRRAHWGHHVPRNLMK